jgi:hypothetical protein
MNRRLLRTTLLVTGVLFAGGLNAQTPKKGVTTLAGMVLGIDGKPVPAAVVSCESAGGLPAHIVHTNSKGKFVITGIRPDSYDLRASADGSYSNWQRNIPVGKGQTKDVTLRLIGANPVPAALPAKQLQKPK